MESAEELAVRRSAAGRGAMPSRIAKYALLLITGLSIVECPIARAQSQDAWNAEVAAWFDQQMPKRLEKAHAAGAVVAVVRQGQTVFLKGYGVAEAGTQRAVDPERTLFRIGSISKVLTAIVALQLRDEGKVDFSADINRYMPKGFTVPAYHGEPVTLDELLSHTGAFSDDIQNYVVTDESMTAMTAQQMQQALPSRFQAPGRYITYDNIGYGLIGLAEQTVTGEPFSQLMQERIFAPLQMGHSGIGLPADRLAEASREHNVMPDGRARVIPYFLLREALKGAGDVSTTAADMSRVMIVLLNRGVIDGQERLLSQAGFADLIDFQAHKMNPWAPTVGRALMEARPAGRRAWMHTGGTYGFGSLLLLFPDDQVGVFMSINSLRYAPDNAGNLAGVLASVTAHYSTPGIVTAFADLPATFAQKFTADPPPVTVPSQPRRGAAQLAGSYALASGQDNLMMRIATRLSSAGVQVQPDDTISVGGEGNYKQKAPWLFEDASSQRQIWFTVRDGETLMYADPVTVLRKLRWYESVWLIGLPLLLCPLALLSSAVYLAGRRRGALQRRFGMLATAGGVLFTGGLLVELQFSATAVLQGREALEHLARLGMIGGLLASLLGTGLICSSWRRGQLSGVFFRAHAAVIVAATVWLTLAAAYWGMLSRL